MSPVVALKAPLLQVSDVCALLVTEPPASSTVPSLSATATWIARPLTVACAAAQTFRRKTAGAPEAGVVADEAPPVGSYSSLVAMELEPPASRILPAFAPWV